MPHKSELRAGMTNSSSQRQLRASLRRKMPRARTSAGLIMYRRRKTGLEVLLVHPGGPYWIRKDKGAWSIPKGEPVPGESLDDAARREFAEEIGEQSAGWLAPLGAVQQAGGKVVHGFAIEGDCVAGNIRSNRFEMEWPPKSGRRKSFPEVDRAEWFSLAAARAKINPDQRALLDALVARLDAGKASRR